MIRSIQMHPFFASKISRMHCRFCAAEMGTYRPFSQLDSIACAKEAQARGLSARLVLACLIHDASECYMSDVPRPFKQTLPEYNRLEDQLLDMIYTHFLGSTLDNAEQEILKDIDNAMLWYDLTYLLHEKQPLPKPQVYDEPDYTVRPFTDVEEEYLQIYRTFIQKLH